MLALTVPIFLLFELPLLAPVEVTWRSAPFYLERGITDHLASGSGKSFGRAIAAV